MQFLKIYYSLLEILNEYPAKGMMYKSQMLGGRVSPYFSQLSI